MGETSVSGGRGGASKPTVPLGRQAGFLRDRCPLKPLGQPLTSLEFKSLSVAPIERNANVGGQRWGPKGKNALLILLPSQSRNALRSSGVGGGPRPFGEPDHIPTEVHRLGRLEKSLSSTRANLQQSRVNCRRFVLLSTSASNFRFGVWVANLCLARQSTASASQYPLASWRRDGGAQVRGRLIFFDIFRLPGGQTGRQRADHPPPTRIVAVFFRFRFRGSSWRRTGRGHHRNPASATNATGTPRSRSEAACVPRRWMETVNTEARAGRGPNGELLG